MDLDLATVLVFVTGLLAGAIAALKLIAPKTKTLKDDKVLEVLEGAEAAVEAVKGSGKPKA